MIPTEADHAARKAYYQTDQWKQLRLMRKHYDGNRCVVCGRWFEDDEPFECHHLTYKSLYNESFDDLATLCHDCHQKAHELENTRKHEPSKCVILAGINYIISKRMEVRGIQGLLELRGKGIRGYGKDHNSIDEGWRIMQDALNALLDKAFDFDSGYAYRYQFHDVEPFYISAVSKEILDRTKETGFQKPKSMAEFLCLSKTAFYNIKDKAALFPSRLEAFNSWTAPY